MSETRKPKVLNKAVTTQTADRLKEDRSAVHQIIQHIFTYTGQHIAEGSFEVISLRGFGKFVPRENLVVRIQEANARKATIRQGKEILRKQKTQDGKAIHDYPGRGTGTEQGVDPDDSGVCNDPEEG